MAMTMSANYVAHSGLSYTHNTFCDDVVSCMQTFNDLNSFSIRCSGLYSCFIIVVVVEFYIYIIGSAFISQCRYWYRNCITHCFCMQINLRKTSRP